MKVNFYPSRNQQTQSFKGVHLVQIPYKAFSEPQNEEKCFSLVQGLILRSLKRNQSVVSGNKTSYIPNFNIVFQHEKLSYSLLNNSMQKKEFCPSVQWIQDNTEIPVGKPIKENYHSFYIYTKHDATDVLNKKRLVQKNMQSLNLNTQYEQYRDPIMKNILPDIYFNALLGTEMDKRLQRYYKIARTHVIGSLAELNKVALKIRTNDKL